MENTLELNLLQLFYGSVSNNFEDVKASESKLVNLYNDPERETYIKLLWKYIMYPCNDKNEPQNIYDKYLNKNVKVSMLISIKNYIIKNVHSNLEDLKLSTDLCIFIKHMCMHALLDSTNDDTKGLSKYYYEILFHLFKYNICDDYDFLLFYILILYISDCNIKYLCDVFASHEKKNSAFVMSIMECVMLYFTNVEILQNLNQNNFIEHFAKIMENLERIKTVLLNREGSLSDDVMSYVGNTNKVYKTNGKYNLFTLSDLSLYNWNSENVQQEGMNNNTDFEFVGKGKLLEDFNNNLKIVSSLKHDACFKNANISLLKKKFLALKVIKKILQNYDDYSYTSKYDLKIILTHIEFPLTLYFVYVYNKFKEFNNYITYKISSSNVNNLENFHVCREMAICFVLMNDLLLNMCMTLKIFYKINLNDLPEYYEDNMEIYFNIFYNIILYETSILKPYFTLIDMSKTIKTGLSTPISNSSFVVNTSGMNYGTSVTSNVPNISVNEMEINSRLTYASLQKLKRTFEKNLAKCKTLVTDIIKIYAEKYQSESKMYILKFIHSLAQLLYKESDKDLLCHDYNCISSTIRLIYHTDLEKSPLNPFKEAKFIQELLNTVLMHIKLKQVDVDEILDADLEYFRNDLNDADSYSLRSTATFFLKTLSDYYKHITMNILQNKILPSDSMMLLKVSSANTLVGKTQIGKTNNNLGTNITDTDISATNSFYQPCSLEYKIQLLNCLGNKELAHNFYDQNLKTLIRKFNNAINIKYHMIEHHFHNINTYIFEVPLSGTDNATTADSKLFSNNAMTSITTVSANNSTSAANNINKKLWIPEDNTIFSAQNNIYLLSVLKFIYCFKEVITYEDINVLFEFLEYMLYNEKVMVHNYSCLCINKMLSQKVNSALLNVISDKVVNHILARLLFLLKYEVSQRILNEYVLTSILRIFIVFPNEANGYYLVVLLLLNDIVNAIVNDTYNPIFNHYMFELITVLVSLIYKSQRIEHIQQVESAIITTFARILQNFIHDFIPYIFQILSIIIDNSVVLQDIHVNILTNLYQLDIWKSSVGNANGIMCVLKSFFKKYNLFQDIIKSNMQELFNIYYYCLSNKKLTMDSFQIIITIFVYLPIDAYLIFVKPLLVLLFNFVQQYKNDIIKIKVMHALSIFILKTNADIFVNTVEEIQTGLIMNVIRSLYMNILDKVINVNEKIVIFLALTKIVNNDRVKNDPLVVEVLECINKNMTQTELEMKKTKTKEKNELDKDDTDKQFDVAYVKLHMVNNENFNELILSNINVTEELKINLLNPHFIQVVKMKGLNNIMNLMNN